MMKKCALLLLAMAAGWSAWAQSESWLWPIDGVRAGTGIVYVPQQHIGDELNFGNLFLTAAEGADVLSPLDGQIADISVDYYRSLYYSISYGTPEDDNFKGFIADIAKELDKRDNPNYLNVSIGIATPDGRTVYLWGLMCDKRFKTGEKIKRGQKLGVVGYSYKAIPEPSIAVSVSNRKGQSDDPMTPFGIRTTFIPPQALKERPVLTADQACEDFDVFVRAVKEAYPGLPDVISEEELERYISSVRASLTQDISREDFYKLMKRAVAKIHDSHITLHPIVREQQNFSLPQIYFGWIDGKMCVTTSKKQYADYYGRRILSVNGISADSIAKVGKEYIGGYDAQVQGVVEERLALGAYQIYNAYTVTDPHPFNMTLKFEDGETLELKEWHYRGGDPELVHDWETYLRTNLYQGANYVLKELNDSTSYIGLSTFSLSEIETEEIGAFIARQAAKPNLIVDLRNNGGGDVKVLRKLLSYILNEPSRERGGYAVVNKIGAFKSFEHCMNYIPIDTIFKEFTPAEGREGFYNFDDAAPIVPDSVINYKGRVYVLINANSCSAATLFPASILRNHRGVIVGRETATAYHYMTALKFADIRLPNSMLDLRIPLVKLVFDTTQHERIPYGRGVIPDHEIRLTLDEVFTDQPDSILNYTLTLIERGEYLGDDPFVQIDNQPDGDCGNVWIYMLVGLFVVGVVAVLIRR